MIDHDRSSVYLCRFWSLWMRYSGWESNWSKPGPSNKKHVATFVSHPFFDSHGSLWYRKFIIAFFIKPISIMFLYLLWLEGWPWQSNRFQKSCAELLIWKKSLVNENTPENWHGTLKSPNSKGKSSYKPPFLGSMSVFQRWSVFQVKLFQTPQAPSYHHWVACHSSARK